MEKIIVFLAEKIGAKNLAVILAVLQMVSAAYFNNYKSKMDTALTATQSQALESVRRAIDQAATIAAQDAEMAAPDCKQR
ncbi:MAG: hypothetical protein WC091_19840 [Sulfuricellaceae bacterium]